MKETNQKRANNILNTPKEYSISQKSRQEINRENYFKHAEERKEQQRVRYAKSKEQVQKQNQEQVNKYSQASDFQVLMSLKEHTELNQAKRKMWLDFVWTYKDLNETKQPPTINNVIEVMRLRELAENLISDYWETAKNEIRKGKSWNSLSEEHKSKLIKYWAREKARGKQELTEAAEEVERQGSQYEKKFEMAKYHEERGKVNCKCWQCEQKAVFQKEALAKKAQIDKKFAEELEEQETEREKGECCFCGKVRKLDKEGVCKNCKSQLE